MSKPKQQTVAIDSLDANPWNPNVQSDFMFEKTIAAVKEFGFIDPVTVRSSINGVALARKQIIDGEHRVRAAKRLGLESVLIVDLGDVSDARAKTLTDVLNRMRGENDAQRWAEMVESIKLEAPEMVELLPYSAAEITAMLAVNTFDWEALSAEAAASSEKAARAAQILFSLQVLNTVANRATALLARVAAEHGCSPADAFGAVFDFYAAQHYPADIAPVGSE